MNYPNSLKNDLFLSVITAPEDLSTCLLSFFRTVDTNQQATSLTLDASAVSSLASTYSSIIALPSDDARHIVQSIQSIFSTSNNFDVQMAPSPLKYNGLGSKLFGMLQQKMGDASSMYLARKTAEVQRAEKTIQDMYHNIDEKIGQPEYKEWPLQAGIGAEIQHPRFRNIQTDLEEPIPGHGDEYKPPSKHSHTGPMNKLCPLRLSSSISLPPVSQQALMKPFVLHTLRLKTKHNEPSTPKRRPYRNTSSSKPFHLIRFSSRSPADSVPINSSLLKPNTTLLSSKMKILDLLKEGMDLEQRLNEIVNKTVEV